MNFRLGIVAFLAGASFAAPPLQQITIHDQRPMSESLTSTADGALIMGSMTKSAIFRAPKGATTATVWIQPGANGLQRILGVFADNKTNTLWVCSSGSPQGGGATALKTFNLKSGAPTGSYDFPGGSGLCNDIAIAPDGTVYATDTTGARVVRLRKGARALDVWAQDSRLNGADGIAFGDGTTIYVNSYFSGQLLRIPVGADGAAGPITPMQTSQPLTHPDGMRTLSNNMLLLVEGAGRLDRITLDGDQAHVEVLRSGFSTPTAVTQIGDTAAWTYAGGRLTPAWNNSNPGTSPVVAGGLLYVYDALAGGLRVYNPETGALLANLPSGKGHWNSPIAVDGRIALPEGFTVGWVHGIAHSDAPGVLDIWSLPDRRN